MRIDHPQPTSSAFRDLSLSLTLRRSANVRLVSPTHASPGRGAANRPPQRSLPLFRLPVNLSLSVARRDERTRVAGEPDPRERAPYKSKTAAVASGRLGLLGSRVDQEDVSSNSASMTSFFFSPSGAASLGEGGPDALGDDACLRRVGSREEDRERVTSDPSCDVA